MYKGDLNMLQDVDRQMHQLTWSTPLYKCRVGRFPDLHPTCIKVGGVLLCTRAVLIYYGV